MKRLLPLLLVAAAPLCLADDKPRTFEVLGVVKKLKPEIRTAVIDHEKIPGYMEAMTMSLEVRDLAELDGLQSGDKIRFRMNVTEDDGWIDQLKLVERTKQATGPSTEPAPLKPIGPGDPFPDANLIDDQGKALKLSDHRGQAIAITFIYTRCPFPTFCPRINSHFKEAQNLLKSDPATPSNWRLLSVTLEPDHDTPEVLSAFAKTQQADPAHWQFATGSLRDITKLTVQSGLNFWDDRGLILHNLRTIVVDPSGKVRKVFGDNELTPEALAKELGEAAREKPCACSEVAS